ncbi:SMC-Scp complex subunit ScpB [uncultured Ruminococcus sp.]|uniref:SMC-Scp complex subunit ScpB n=1 Tax=uncultured Ruminococcus sp. TaxID=165186 RepID=UPI0025DDCE39|nr:SMC-Scp complex subunit ScpB [uncultured Ruminococcus sp.]
MTNEQLVCAVEAILFASGDPVEPDRLCAACGCGISRIEEAIETLKERYENSAIDLLTLNGSYQFATKKEYSQYIKNALEIKRNSALSPAAMEALAIVAYNQPVTKGFVESVRGVDSSGVVNSLVDKGLLAEAGRLDLPGRPIAYETTDNFLRAFKLSSLKDLPELPEQTGQITMEEVIESAENDPDNPINRESEKD